MPDTAKLADLKASLRGELIEPKDPAYEEARALYNGMIDKRPAAIARCTDVADVIAAVNLGRDNALPIAIRGGGHNGPGLGSVNDGLVIDLSQMKGVRVDPAAREARVAAGCTQGDVDHATHAFGLAVPAGIISTTGIAGLTLSGGHGYLSRKYGLTIDNLLEADVVLADGSFVTASKEKDADLLWALRGGGGNFGVVTSFLFQLHSVKMVFAGPIAWDQTHARTIMQRYREFLPKAPEELGAFVGLKKIPSSAPFPQEVWGKLICLLMSCYNGAEAEGRKALAPLLDGPPRAVLQLDEHHALSRRAEHVRRALPEGHAVVLAGRLRQDPARCGNRCPSRAGGEDAERAIAHASLSDRRRGSPGGQGRHGVELPGCDVVDGHCRHRS